MKSPTSFSATAWLTGLRDADLDQVVEALQAANLRRTSRERRAQWSALGSDAERVYSYAESRERRLREEGSLARELLNNLEPRGRGEAMVQQEITLRGSAGGVAGGRFRLANATDTPVALGFDVGAPEDAAGQTIRVSLTPPAPQLAPRGSLTVRILVELTAIREEGTLTFPVDVRDGQRRRERIWVNVEVMPAERSEP